MVNQIQECFSKLEKMEKILRDKKQKAKEIQDNGAKNDNSHPKEEDKK